MACLKFRLSVQGESDVGTILVQVGCVVHSLFSHTRVAVRRSQKADAFDALSPSSQTIARRSQMMSKGSFRGVCAPSAHV